jgi:hypothetical protein
LSLQVAQAPRVSLLQEQAYWRHHPAPGSVAGFREGNLYAVTFHGDIVELADGAS